MNVVFAVQNNDEWNSKISSVFGRAIGFMKYSEETKQLSFHSNTENVNAGHGAGVQAGQVVVTLGADIVITGGSIGPKAFDVLKSVEMKKYSQVGEITIKQAYANYKNNKYQETLSSDK